MKNIKRILAIITIIILVALYIITLVAAIIGSEASNTLFIASLITSVLFPIMLFVFFATADFLKSYAEKKAKQIAESDDSTK
ncbi:MAG: hypothetical protein J6L69_11100 [Lachnospiraceae bacterium]|nr:hypothetical protein [Lachnospiraceae bacterium]